MGIFDRKIHGAEKSGGAEKSTLDNLREELEGLSVNTTQIAKKKSIAAKVRKIRNAHLARCGFIFFKRELHGNVVFMPHGGKNLIRKLFLSPRRH